MVDRLRHLIPAADLRSTSGINTKELAEIIGTSRHFANMAITGPSFFSYVHGRKIAEAYGVTPGFVLASELLKRFDSIESVATAVKKDTPAFQSLIIKLYATRFANRDLKLEAFSNSESLVRAWRHEVNKRLAVHLATSNRSVSGVSTNQLAYLIGTKQSYGVAIVNGPNFLSSEQASIIAKEFGKKPEFYQAADWLASNFNSYEDLERQLAGEKPALTAMLLRSYVIGRENEERMSHCPGLDR